jgi:acetolactate synthase-1/2/3 large subunit
MPTVADVLVDGLLRAGVARGFTHTGATTGAQTAWRQRGLAVVEAGAPDTACLLAAVTGDIGEGPGVALLAAEAIDAAGPGLRYAVASRAPMLILGERVPLPVIGALGLKGSVTLTTESAAQGTAHALQLAQREPRGPVFLALDHEIAGEPAVPVATAVRPAPLPPPDGGALDEAARRLGGAVRPVLVVGLECRAGDAPKWLRPLAETLPAPVLVTPRARGVLPDPHPLNLGPVAEGAALLARADLVVAVGVDALEAVPGGWAASVLHLGATPPARADWTPAAQVVGDIALVIEELAPRLRGHRRADWDVAELDRLKRGRIGAARTTGLGPQRVVALVREITPAGTIAAVDGGLGAAAAAAWVAVGPNELLTAGEAGPRSFAVTAALAAQLACPDRRAIAFADAGGLARGDDALAVAARLGAPVLVIALGASDTDGPLALAARLDMTGVLAPTERALAQTVAAALAGSAPFLIDARAGRV